MVKLYNKPLIILCVAFFLQSCSMDGMVFGGGKKLENLGANENRRIPSENPTLEEIKDYSSAKEDAPVQYLNNDDNQNAYQNYKVNKAPRDFKEFREKQKKIEVKESGLDRSMDQVSALKEGAPMEVSEQSNLSEIIDHNKKQQTKSSDKTKKAGSISKPKKISEYVVTKDTQQTKTSDKIKKQKTKEVKKNIVNEDAKQRDDSDNIEAIKTNSAELKKSDKKKQNQMKSVDKLSKPVVSSLKNIDDNESVTVVTIKAPVELQSPEINTKASKVNPQKNKEDKPLNSKAAEKKTESKDKKSEVVSDPIAHREENVYKPEDDIKAVSKLEDNIKVVSDTKVKKDAVVKKVVDNKKLTPVKQKKDTKQNIIKDVAPVDSSKLKAVDVKPVKLNKSGNKIPSTYLVVDPSDVVDGSVTAEVPEVNQDINLVNPTPQEKKDTIKEVKPIVQEKKPAAKAANPIIQEAKTAADIRNKSHDEFKKELKEKFKKKDNPNKTDDMPSIEIIDDNKNQ